MQLRETNKFVEYSLDLYMLDKTIKHGFFKILE